LDEDRCRDFLDPIAAAHDSSQGYVSRQVAAPIFVQALASLRPSTRILISSDENGVARGALRLANVMSNSAAELKRASLLPIDITDYRQRWREAAESAI